MRERTAPLLGTLPLLGGPITPNGALADDSAAWAATVSEDDDVAVLDGWNVCGVGVITATVLVDFGTDCSPTELRLLTAELVSLLSGLLLSEPSFAGTASP